MSSSDYEDRAEIRAIIKAAKDKKPPRKTLHRGRFGIMAERTVKRRKIVMCECGKIRLKKACECGRK